MWAFQLAMRIQGGLAELRRLSAIILVSNSKAHNKPWILRRFNATKCQTAIETSLPHQTRHGTNGEVAPLCPNSYSGGGCNECHQPWTTFVADAYFLQTPRCRKSAAKTLVKEHAFKHCFESKHHQCQDKGAA